MNELDDYDFNSVENSNLSSIFGRDQLSEATDSLVYRAPKQPYLAKGTKNVPPTNFSYKYINLYEIVGAVPQQFGKHIICILKSEANSPEILIYQNKKNILIRNSIGKIYISTYPEKKYCLGISNNGRKFLVEYTNKGDYSDFISEFTSIGGVIQKKVDADSHESKPQNPGNLERKNLPLLHPTVVLSNLTTIESVSSSSIEQSSEGEKISEAEDQKEKEVILARLAKMGLPQLPSLQKDSTDASISTILPPTTEPIKDKYKEETNSELATINHDYTLVTHRNLDGESSNIQQIQMLNRPIDPISFIMAENQMHNAELRHQLSLLTSSINKINSEPVGNKTDESKSKLRAYRVKSENLETELNRLKKKYAELQKFNEELLEKHNNSREEIHSKDENNLPEKVLTGEVNNYKSHLTELLIFIQNLPLKPIETDITMLKNMKENIEDAEITLLLEKCISVIENDMKSKEMKHDSSVVKIRTNFLKGTKHIMNNLYLKCSNLLEDEELKIILAEDIRSTTLELVRNYDEKIHDSIRKYT